MNNYTLQENETILFRGSCIFMPNGKREQKNEEKSDIILTNLNIVLFIKKKKLFKTIEEAYSYSLSDVKIYDETVQIIRRKAVVDVYLKECELFVDFCKEKDAREFCDKALREISGFSKFVRGVKKAQKAIKETNEALDIDVVELAKSGANFACEVALTSGTATAAKGGKKVSSAIAEAVLRRIGKKETKDCIEAANKENDT